MRLLQRTNRIYLLFTAALLLVSGCALYVIITGIISDEATEKLLMEQELVVRVLQKNAPVPSVAPVMEVDRVANNTIEQDMLVKDTMMRDPTDYDEDNELFRQVTTLRMINGRSYRITTRTVILEPHDYLLSIGLALLIGSLLLLLGLWFVNRRVSRTVWGSFRHNLIALRQFDLHKDDPLSLEPSDITEFSELNEAVTKLTERIRSDHRALKEFATNASHEMQTPLAIVQVKLEEALARPGMDESQVAPIRIAYDSVLRLSRLHQSLLLLSRIEHQQFSSDQRVDLAATVDAQLELYSDRIAAKELAVDTDLDRSASVLSHPTLIEALLSNLIGNGIKHNRPGGNIRIAVRSGSITVVNTGDPLSVPAEGLFERFSKADPTSASPGLGLSIARSICVASGWLISYTERDGMHTVRVDL